MKQFIQQAGVDLKTQFGTFEFAAFSENESDLMPHLVLKANGEFEDKITNVRIHSECITGDLFGSFRCDCGEQLQASMEYISKNGGMIIYLRQEGRGIGIINKIKAYNQQDLGFDTAEANKKLGLQYDARLYDEAIMILNHYKIKQINLLTNNPDKLKAFDGSDVEVVKRIPLEINPHNDNRAYLKTKKDFFGHILELV